ncbi:hypothetical protein FRC17_001482 [Serendipita sp. 399]|nr:hypothetical protein FRC17_001482 [Serendipita sp. 399]
MDTAPTTQASCPTACIRTSSAGFEATPRTASRFWSIHELVCLMIDCIDTDPEAETERDMDRPPTADLASLARVNKFVGHLALERLWEVVKGFDKLMRLIPDNLLDVVGPFNEDLQENVSKKEEPQLVSGLDRYLIYTEFVKSIEVLGSDSAVSNGPLPTIQSLVDQSDQVNNHFRNLKRMIMAHGPKTEPGVVLAFFIERIMLDFDPWANRLVVENFFQVLLPQYLFRVKVLQFAHDAVLNSRILRPIIRPILRELPSLEQLGLCLTIEAAHKLLCDGIHESQECSTLAIRVLDQKESENSEKEPYYLNDSDDPMISREPQAGNRFSSSRQYNPSNSQIRNVTFLAHNLDDLDGVIQIFKAKMYRLESLYLKMTREQTSVHLSRSLTGFIQISTELNTLIYQDRDRSPENHRRGVILPHSLECLASLSHLQCLSIDCVATFFVTDELLFNFCHKFPLVKKLVLGPRYRYRDSRITDMRLATLFSALKFASTCPNLTYLGIRLDARKASAPSKAGDNDTILVPSLEYLDLGASYIDDAEYVSSLLRLMTPSLNAISWSEPNSKEGISLSHAEYALFKIAWDSLFSKETDC